MRVAVTGATGIVGRFVCARLLAQGHTVQALCRPTSITAGFTQQPHWVVGELDEESALQQLLEGME
ncbi:MAG: NAD(P)H-binding protein, partial [Pseudomonadales bacterium]